LSQSPTDPFALEIESLERRVWDALINADTATDNALLSTSFLGVYPDGFAGKMDHAGQLQGGPTVMDYILDNIHFRLLGEKHAMLSYKAKFRRPNRPASEIMFVTSVWEREGKSWINIFSQDTPAQNTVS
jgi:hypothetical protein